MLKIIRVIFALTFFFSVKLNAQINKTDSLATVLENYSRQNKSSVLFIHFDKNVYTNNDQVWFTGYLLKSIVDLDRYNTLYLSLINNSDSSIVLQQKFLIDKGYAFGSFTLPDSLQSGSYRFVSNTNIKLNGIPDVEFTQPITIKSTTINPLVANLSLFKSNDEQTRNGTVLLKALTSDNHFIADAEVNYVIGKNNQTLKIGKAKTSIIGEVMIDYPADKITNENNLVSVLIKKGLQKRYEQFEIPVEKENQYRINFYPEGGYIISDIQNKVGWEVKDLEGASISAKAVLFLDNQAIDTIQTNSSGIGSFSLRPKANQEYFVRLLIENSSTGKYELPKSLKSGINIKLNSAIGDDELRMFVESSVNNKAHLVVHNYENIYLSTELNLLDKKRIKILLKLDSVPKGINTITLLDSHYRPVAERIFFAHYDELSQIQINLNKEEYLARDSVKVKLKISDNNGNGLKGIVSVACVQANRILISNKTNIVDYNYIESKLNHFPLNLSGIKYSDKNYLEDILLVKGWRKYKWPDENEHNLPIENKVTEFEYSGTITKGKKLLKKPLSLNTITAQNISSLNTDSSGHFVLPYHLLITEEKNKVWLNMNENNYNAFDVKLNDPLDEIKSYVKNTGYEFRSLKAILVESNLVSMTNFSGIKLKEVTIKKQKDDLLIYGVNINKCGDYVCGNGYLNCPNHRNDPHNKAAVKGKTYKLIAGGFDNYEGCSADADKPNFFILKGISLPKAFYISDIKNMNEPINFSTAYWNYQMTIDEKGETPLTFSTGDLTGEFKIIIQGVTEKGPVYGEKTIVVKK